MHIFIISDKGITCLWLFSFVYSFQQHWVCSCVAYLLNTDGLTDEQVAGGKWKQPALCKRFLALWYSKAWTVPAFKQFPPDNTGGTGSDVLSLLMSFSSLSPHIWHCQFCGSNNPEMHKILLKLCKGGNGGGLQEAAVKITRACVWAHRENY